MLLALPYTFLDDNQVILNSDEWAHRLISVAEGQEAWMTQDQIFELYKKGVKFIDVTNEWQELDSLTPPWSSGKCNVYVGGGDAQSSR